MKYNVAGWTSYDDPDLEEGDCTDAALEAIIDDVMKHGYLFSGWDHGEGYCCAPVLNDGKKRLFSERGFGELMARAMGDESLMGYCRFAFEWSVSESEKKLPTDPSYPLYREDFTPDTDLFEEFCLSIDEEKQAEARSGRLTLDYSPALRFMDEGDLLTLTSESGKASYKVLSAERKKDLTEEEMAKIIATSHDDREKAEKMYKDAGWIIEIKLEGALS